MKITLKFDKCIDCPYYEHHYAGKGAKARIMCGFPTKKQFVCYFIDAFDTEIPKECPLNPDKSEGKWNEWRYL